MTNKKWYEYIPIRIQANINITFAKIVFTCIIFVGLQSQNVELVKIGALGFVGRKIGSSLVNYFINK